MSSLPGFRIVDTYKAYKLREHKFTAWLRETGEKLGHTISKSKTKDRREYPVPISEIPNLVQLIISQGQSIPDSLRHVLRDVISQRKEAAAFYRARGQGENDHGHAFYVKVLEDALKTFDSFGRKKSPGTNPAEQGESSCGQRDIDLSNIFELLDLEGEILPMASNSGSGSDRESEKESQSTKKPRKIKSGKRKGKAKKSKKVDKSLEKAIPATEVNVFESIVQHRDIDYEDDDDDDLYFMIYCFFKDWNHLREYLQERWCDYQDGFISLAAVSLITNTAFELLQRSEQELLSQIPRQTGLASYQSMAEMLFFDIGLAHVDYDEKASAYNDDEEGMSETIYEEADWICLSRYWDLAEWLDNVPPKKVPTLGQYIGKPVTYHADSYRDKTSRDRQILYELIAECCLIKAFKNHPTFHIPGEDNFTRGLTTMLATRRTPIWLILASQIQCDIRYILEFEVEQCHQELQTMGNRVRAILGDYIKFAEVFDVPLRGTIRITFDEAECWITEDFAEPKRSELHLSHGVSESDVEPFYYLRRHPLLCGLMIFRFSLTMNEIGLDNSNQWGATIAAAHLYNAIRHEQLDSSRWLDMEALVLIHSNQRIFWRDHLPSDPGQYSRSYERATGASEMIAQRQASVDGPSIRPKKAEQRGIAPVSIVSAQYHRRFCFANTHPINTLPQVESLLNSIADQEIERSLSGLRLLEAPNTPRDGEDPARITDIEDSSRISNGEGASRIANPEGRLIFLTNGKVSNYQSQAQQSTDRAVTAQFQRTHALTNTQLLDVLCTRIMQESYTLNFDYFSFHTRCMLLLKAVYNEFEEEVKRADGELDWGSAEMPVVPHWLFKWMEDEAKRADVVERLGKTMKDVVEKEGTREIMALRTFLSRGGGRGDKIQMHHLESQRTNA